jgi:outer membrane murein-binding lipoprotein Lpp
MQYYVAVGNNPVTILTSSESYYWIKQTIDFSSPLSKVLYAENENNVFVIMGGGKFFTFTINTVISIAGLSDLMSMNQRINTLDSSVQNLNTSIQNLSAENITYTRSNAGTNKGPQNFNLNDRVITLKEL